MSRIEPNLEALFWFVLLWSTCCLGFLQVAGMYPISSHRGRLSSGSTLLALGNTALWLALVAGTARFAYVELRWTTIVVVAGIVFLFVPDIFQALPARWRDGEAGLALGCCVIVFALGLLAWIGASSIGLRS